MKVKIKYGPGTSYKSFLEKNLGMIVTPCPGCGERPAMECGYGEFDQDGDFDCTDPDKWDIDCESCPRILCDVCAGRIGTVAKVADLIEAHAESLLDDHGVDRIAVIDLARAILEEVG